MSTREGVKKKPESVERTKQNCNENLKNIPKLEVQIVVDKSCKRNRAGRAFTFLIQSKHNTYALDE
jgi:flagellar biosynthesis/type III secretory pathway M-ring protein FliF/YscJ